jgi:hypothetical protein
VPTIRVDYDGLRALADRLAELHTRIAAHGAYGLAGRCGDPIVAAALQDVEDDWSRRRQVVCDYLGAAGSAVAAAARAYAEADHAVGAAAHVGSGR